MSMNRFDSAGSSERGLGLRGIGAAYTEAAYSSNGSRSWRGSGSKDERGRRRLSERRRDGAARETSCFISQPLALCAYQRAIGPRHVINAERDPIVVAEIKLGRVAMQMRLADVEIAAVDATLEDRKEVFDRVGMPERGAHIFLGAVVDGAVSVEIASDSGINWRVVGHQIGRLIDVRDNDRLQALCGHVLHMKAADSLRIAADCYRLLPSNAGRGNLGRRLV
jgi:hypothetical protein